MFVRVSNTKIFCSKKKLVFFVVVRSAYLQRRLVGGVPNGISDLKDIENDFKRRENIPLGWTKMKEEKKYCNKRIYVSRERERGREELCVMLLHTDADRCVELCRRRVFCHSGKDVWEKFKGREREMDPSKNPKMPTVVTGDNTANKIRMGEKKSQTTIGKSPPQYRRHSQTMGGVCSGICWRVK